MNNRIFRFIDLFAGIGGIRIAFEEAGGQCVFSSEYDRFAQLTYKAFFGEKPDFTSIFRTDPPGDITAIPPEMIPDHEILTGGFPCQPFSLAGVSKKNSLGRPHGFADPTQGTLFFNVKEIIKAKQPQAFLLENVKNLKNHDRGMTYQVIKDTLHELNYTCFYRVIDANGWVPQHRERIFIVGFRNPDQKQAWEVKSFDELFELVSPENPKSIDSILEAEVPAKYTLTEKTWATLERHKKHHAELGNGFGYGLISAPFEGKTTRTMSARYNKDGAEILINQRNIGLRPRRLTPYEVSGLMGFPEKYRCFFSRAENIIQPVSDSQAYHQFGNSVAVPLVTDIAKLIVSKLHEANA
jgi:DNA (cytosine-5)-methyltransferase 1